MRTLRAALLPCVCALVIAGCTKTNVETKTVVQVVHDTTHVPSPAGPALVRFISMIPGVSSLTLWRTADKTGSPFAGVFASTSLSYYPVADSTALTLYPDYYINGHERIDSVTIPGSLSPFSLTTFGLFYVDDGHGTNGVYLKGNSDQAKVLPPPDGMCYIRFINGMLDYPSPTAELYLYVDSTTHSLFHEGTIAAPILGGQLSDYVLMPSGSHKIFTATPSGEELDSTHMVFESGGYYTARVQGKRSDLTSKFLIDAE